jgi:hypothetical protein
MTAYNGYKLFIGMKVGKVWLQIDEFDKEFLYQTPYPGLGSNDIGLDRGKIGSLPL